ncbi:hypothetical protein A8G00_01155 [Sphingobium sp. SA916]|nr:hypothetical protein A8G00_01155 [Sphingobium sp. SA916]
MRYAIKLVLDESDPQVSRNRQAVFDLKTAQYIVVRYVIADEASLKNTALRSRLMLVQPLPKSGNVDAHNTEKSKPPRPALRIGIEIGRDLARRLLHPNFIRTFEKAFFEKAFRLKGS